MNIKINKIIIFSLRIILCSLLIACENPYMKRDLQEIMDARDTFTVTVIGGEGSGRYIYNKDTVEIKATPPTGQTFKNWTANPAVSFADYESPTTSFTMPKNDVTVTAIYENTTATITGIVITNPPDKTDYYLGDTLDLTGLVVTASYDNGSSSPVTITASHISGFDSSVAGVQTVTVTYEGFTDSFTVTVINLTVTGISITTPPTKTTYIVGEALDLAGLVVTATLSDTTTYPVTITSENITGFNTNSITSTPRTVTIDYNGHTATFTITVNPKTITITGVTAVDRVYEAGNTTVALTGGTLVGVLDIHTVSFDLGNGTIEDDTVGNGKAVTTSITLTGTDAANYTLTQPTGITVNITVAPVYSISLSETGTLTFTSVNAGYSPVTAQSVTVTNEGNQATGNLTVALSGLNATSFTLSATTISSIAVSGTGSFTIKPNDSLTAGTYTATVTVSGNNSISASFAVSFIVIPTFAVTVNEGTTDKTAYAENETVTITANAPPGQQFSHWTVVSGLATAPSGNPATFTMPAEAVSVTANFEAASVYTFTGTVTRANLLTAINNIEEGGTIIFPAGTHNMNDAITINKDITILGTAPGTTITESAYNQFLTVTANLILGGNGVDLIIDGGNSGATQGRYGILVNGGTVEMNDGVTITGFRSVYEGAGVNVNNGTFTMNGGEISGNNSQSRGGGVTVAANASFTMNDGTISGNIANGNGGGVYLSTNANFTMNGGTIYGTDAGAPLANTGTNAAIHVVTPSANIRYGNGDPITSSDTTIHGVP